ncbi:MAG: MotA/TolQ/ExbB proton channel family protein [Hungatella sp.]
MDFSTIIGIVGGSAIVIWGISLSGSIMNFFDPASIVIVIGGSIAAIVASFPFSILKDIPHHMVLLVQKNKYDHFKCIETLVDYATEARKNGLLALEAKSAEEKDVFFKNALMLVVDAHEPAEVKERLNNELDFLWERHENGIGIYEKGAAVAPAFGMIGTLVGLINMLKSLDISSGANDSLGLNMSVAMVTTFYGCMLSHLMFAPIAKKLSIRNAEEYLYKQLIIEGVLAIQRGDNPKFLREKLVCYLGEKKRDIGNPEAEGAGKKGKVKKEKGGKKEKKE